MPTGSPAQAPLAVLDTMIGFLREGNLDSLAGLYADDGVHALPFAPPGAPHVLEGRDAIRSYFTETLADVPLRFDEFVEVAVHDTGDPEVLVAEYDGHGSVVGAERRFVVRYLWVLRIRDGEIVEWRDYWNPQEIIALQAEARG